MKELQAIVGHLCRSKAPAVLATLTAVEGSSYRRPGARMLITDGHVRTGAISGGCLEEDLIARSKRVAASGLPELVVYDTTAENDIVWGVGLGCNGVVRILLERVPPRPPWAVALEENLRAGRATELVVVWDAGDGPVGTRLRDDPVAGRQGSGSGVFRERVGPPTSLSIFGAGDDAQPLARMALELGWRVTVADPRPAMPTEERFPGVFALVLGPLDELVARSAPLPGSLAVVMTHHYRHDVPLLRHLLPIPLSYLGLLGPRRRTERILSEIAQAGLAITPAMRARLRAPVGLDLGADAPEEVALSIVAEMRSVVSGRDARPLRERELQSMPDPSPQPFRLGAIILAAGGSARMGATKQLLKVDRASLVARAADAALGSGAKPVAVVLGADAENVRVEISAKPVLVAYNADWATGLASSIRAGIATLLCADSALDAVVIAPCDQPALSAETIMRLATVHRSTGLIAAARFGGRNAAPAVFGRAHFAALSTLSGHEGARGLLNSDLGLVSPVDLPAMGADLDTPEEYTSWIQAQH